MENFFSNKTTTIDKELDSITQKKTVIGMELEQKEESSTGTITKADRLNAAINSINMANDMLRENQSKIEREIIEDIIPLSLYVKIKTSQVRSIIITRQELQEMVKENLPMVKGHRMYLYRYEVHLNNDTIEYYFYQMYIDSASEFQKELFNRVFDGIEVQILDGFEDTNRKETSKLMEQQW